MASRGGRRADLPVAGWQPPQRLAAAEPTSVRFVEETGGWSRTFDFARLPVEPAVQQWFARVFARLAGARSAVKRRTSAAAHYNMIERFAATLAATFPAPRTPQELSAAHIEAFRRRLDGVPAQHDYVKRLRGLLRDDPELPPSARDALVALRIGKPQPSVVTAYDAREWQQLMTLLRHDVRVARDRVRAGHVLLGRYRAGVVPADGAEAVLGQLLDVFDRTGDLPRTRSGDHTGAVLRAGGFRSVGMHLCIDHAEAVAFCLLLTALTAENYGTVTRWPAMHHRPDGRHADGGVALLEEVKPRRGPDREHMVTALEDVPAGLQAVLDGGGDDGRLMRSPLRIYRLLLELTSLARRHGGHDTAVSVFTPTCGPHGGRFSNVMTSSHVFAWARGHGLPTARTATAATLPPVHVGRLRQTAIEQRRHPVGHSRRTMHDVYLRRSPTVQADSRIVVGDALREQVDKARTQQRIPVFGAAFLALAQQSPHTAAAEAGVDLDVLTELIHGQRDTAVAACTDHLSGPHTDPGQPCPASFLTCLNCPNARALPHHLPAQLAVRDQLAALHPHLDPAIWQHRHQPTAERLDDLLTSYTPAEQARARAQITDRHRRMAADLVDGRLDLR